jgi:hypothetical protein
MQPKPASSDARISAQARRWAAIGGVGLTAVLAGVVLAALLSSRGALEPLGLKPTPTPMTEEPSVSPAVEPSLEATPTPSATIRQEETALRPDMVAQVITTDLVVRSAPGVGPSSEILPERLDAMLDSIPAEPQLVFLVDGPVTADGYEWYLVKPFTLNLCHDVCTEPPFGWVAAASRDGEPWIMPHTLDCPEPTVEDLMWLSDMTQLACYGTETLVIDGEAGECFVAERPEPSFQTWCFLHPPAFEWPEEGGLGPWGIGVFVQLVDWPQPGSQVVVTGQFDHSVAVECQGISDETAREFGMDPASLPAAPLWRLSCRSAFFATRVELLSR